jgi:hypothetical protein
LALSLPFFAFSTPYSNAAKSVKTSLTKLALHNKVFSLLSTMCAAFFAGNCWNVAILVYKKIRKISKIVNDEILRSFLFVVYLMFTTYQKKTPLSY